MDERKGECLQLMLIHVHISSQDTKSKIEHQEERGAKYCQQKGGMDKETIKLFTLIRKQQHNVLLFKFVKSYPGYRPREHPGYRLH